MPDKKAEQSGFILERTAKRMKQHIQQQLAAAAADITVDQWILMQELEKTPGVSQLELARATFKDAPTVTRIIDLLCAKGLATRTPDPNDRRRFIIQLTSAGRQKIEAVLPIVKAARLKAWAGLDDRQMDQLTEILNRVFENLNPGDNGSM